jgi:hypothetical protein
MMAAMDHANLPADRIEAFAAELAPEPNAAERTWLVTLERAYVGAPNHAGRQQAIQAAGNGPSDRCEKFAWWLTAIEAEAATAKPSFWGTSKGGPSRYVRLARCVR